MYRQRLFLTPFMQRLAPPLQEMNVSLFEDDFGSGAGQKAEVPVKRESRKCMAVLVFTLAI